MSLDKTLLGIAKSAVDTQRKSRDGRNVVSKGVDAVTNKSYANEDKKVAAAALRKWENETWKPKVEVKLKQELQRIAPKLKPGSPKYQETYDSLYNKNHQGLQAAKAKAYQQLGTLRQKGQTQRQVDNRYTQKESLRNNTAKIQSAASVGRDVAEEAAGALATGTSRALRYPLQLAADVGENDDGGIFDRGAKALERHEDNLQQVYPAYADTQQNGSFTENLTLSAIEQIPNLALSFTGAGAAAKGAQLAGAGAKMTAATAYGTAAATMYPQAYGDGNDSTKQELENATPEQLATAVRSKDIYKGHFDKNIKAGMSEDEAYQKARDQTISSIAEESGDAVGLATLALSMLAPGVGSFTANRAAGGAVSQWGQKVFNKLAVKADAGKVAKVAVPAVVGAGIVGLNVAEEALQEGFTDKVAQQAAVDVGVKEKLDMDQLKESVLMGGILGGLMGGGVYVGTRNSKLHQAQDDLKTAQQAYAEVAGQIPQLQQQIEAVSPRSPEGQALTARVEETRAALDAMAAEAEKASIPRTSLARRAPRIEPTNSAASDFDGQVEGATELSEQDFENALNPDGTPAPQATPAAPVLSEKELDAQDAQIAELIAEQAALDEAIEDGSNEKPLEESIAAAQSWYDSKRGEGKQGLSGVVSRAAATEQDTAFAQQQESIKGATASINDYIANERAKQQQIDSQLQQEAQAATTDAEKQAVAQKIEQREADRAKEDELLSTREQLAQPYENESFDTTIVGADGAPFKLARFWDSSLPATAKAKAIAEAFGGEIEQNVAKSDWANLPEGVQKELHQWFTGRLDGVRQSREGASVQTSEQVAAPAVEQPQEVAPTANGLTMPVQQPVVEQAPIAPVEEQTPIAPVEVEQVAEIDSTPAATQLTDENPVINIPAPITDEPALIELQAPVADEVNTEQPPITVERYKSKPAARAAIKKQKIDPQSVSIVSMEDGYAIVEAGTNQTEQADESVAPMQEQQAELANTESVATDAIELTEQNPVINIPAPVVSKSATEPASTTAKIYKSKPAAQAAIKKQKLSPDSVSINQVKGGGFEIVKKAPLKPTYAQAQEQAATELGMTLDETGEYGGTDAELETFFNRIDEIRGRTLSSSEPDTQQPPSSPQAGAMQLTDDNPTVNIPAPKKTPRGLSDRAMVREMQKPTINNGEVDYKSKLNLSEDQSLGRLIMSSGRVFDDAVVKSMDDKSVTLEATVNGKRGLHKGMSYQTVDAGISNTKSYAEQQAAKSSTPTGEQSAPAKRAAAKKQASIINETTSETTTKQTQNDIKDTELAEQHGFNDSNRLDHGELSIPNRTNNIDSEIDSYKRDKAKLDAKKLDAVKAKNTEKAAAEKDRLLPIKEQAQVEYKQYGTAMVKAYKDKLDAKGVNARDFFRDEAKYNPEAFLKLSKKFQEEQQVKPTPSGDWRSQVGGNEIRDNKDGITVRKHDRVVHIRGANSIAANKKARELASQEIRELHYIAAKENPSDPFSEASIWLDGEGDMIRKKGTKKPKGALLQVLKQSESSPKSQPTVKPDNSNDNAGMSSSTEAKFSKTNPAKGNTGTTAKQVVSTLQKRFGKEVVAALIKSGKLRVRTLNDFVNADGRLLIPSDAEGFYYDGKVTLIADNLTADNAIATLLHEMGGHAGIQSMLAPQTYMGLMTNFDNLVKSGNKYAVAAKERAEAVTDTESEARDEYIPYLITEYAQANERSGPLAVIKRFVNRVLAGVRAWVRNHTGIQLNVTPNDIVQLAERMVKRLSEQSTSGLYMAGIDNMPAGQAQFSQAPAPQSQVDAVRKQYEGTDSWMKAPNGLPSKLTELQWLQVRTPSFKNWFGDWENGQRTENATGLNERADRGVRQDKRGKPNEAITRSMDDTRSNGERDSRDTGNKRQSDSPNSSKHNPQRIFNLDPETGEPRVLSHGTRDKFFVFDNAHANKKDFGWLGVGHYFATDEPLARLYAFNKKGNAGLSVMNVYLNARNPFVATQSLKNMIRDGGKAEAEEFTQYLIDNGHDSVVLDNGADNLEVMVLDANQVKSATDNAGTFDSSNPDIRFSRRYSNADQSEHAATKQQRASSAVRLGAAAASAANAGTIRLMRRHVATPQHVAILNPDFRKAHDNIQARLAYENHEAGKVQVHVPEIWQTRLLVGKRKKDIESVSKALFDGTMADKVWDNDELVDKFGLTPKQINLYERMRASINDSLGNMTVDTLSALAKGTKLVNIETINRLKLTDSTPTDHNFDMQKHMTDELERLDKGGLLSKAAVKRMQGQLDDVFKVMDSVVDKFENLIDQGYAPLMRFGNYAVEVRNKDTGELDLFELYEGTDITGPLAQWKAIKDLEKKYDLDKYTISKGTLNPDAFKQFTDKGLNPETVQLFASELGLDSDGAIQAYLKVAISDRSALKRLIHRKKIAGYSEDMPRVVSAFVMSNARHSGRMLYNGEIESSIQKIKDGNLQGEMQNVFKNMEDPQEEYAGVRNTMFHWFMAFSPAFLLLNLTQPFTQTIPKLAAYTSATRAHTDMAHALGIVGKYSGKATWNAAKWVAGKDDPNWQGFEDHLPVWVKKEDYLRMSREGHLDPQNVWMIRGLERGKTGVASGAWGGFENLAGWPAEVSEGINRRSTMIAAFKVAKRMGPAKLKQKGFDSDYEFAVSVIQQTQGIYNKGNRSGLARGTGKLGQFGPLVMVFKQFTINYVEQMIRHGRDKEFKSLALMMLWQFGIAGMFGLPFVDDLRDILEGALYRVFGKSFNLADELENLMGKTAAQNLMYGVPSNNNPIDFYGRSSMGNLLPLTDFARPNEGDWGELIGASSSFFENFYTASKYLAEGRYRDAVVVASPRYVKDAVNGYEIYTTGSYRNHKGDKVMDMSKSDGLIKGLGQFNPSSNAKPGRERSEGYHMKNMIKNNQDRYSLKLAEAIYEENDKLYDEIYEEMDAWNERNKEPYLIDIEKVEKSAENRVEKKDFGSAERNEKALPDQLEGYLEDKAGT